MQKDKKDIANNHKSVIVFISPTRQHKPNQTNKMHTHTQTRVNASKIKSVMERIANVSCDIAKDGKSYRVSCDAINSNVFNAVRDMVEAGNKPSSITAQDIV